MKEQPRTTTVYVVRVQFANLITGFIETKEFTFASTKWRDRFVEALPSDVTAVATYEDFIFIDAASALRALGTAKARGLN